MTNGEIIHKQFPQAEIEMPTIFETKVKVLLDLDCTVKFPIEWWNAEYQDPTIKNDLAVECINRAELLKAMDTWDKFGNDPNKGLIPLRTSALQDRYVPYVKYDDMVNCVKGMPSVTPIRPKGHWRKVDTNMYACSNCSHVLTIDPLDNSILEMNTCPFCSTKMEGVVEE